MSAAAGSRGVPLRFMQIPVIKDYPLNTDANITDESQQVLGANPDRLHVILVNNGNNTVYLGFGENKPAVANKGVRLNRSGGALTIDWINLYQGRITAICASGETSSLTILEGVGFLDQRFVEVFAPYG